MTDVTNPEVITPTADQEPTTTVEPSLLPEATKPVTTVATEAWGNRPAEVEPGKENMFASNEGSIAEQPNEVMPSSGTSEPSNTPDQNVSGTNVPETPKANPLSKIPLLGRLFQ